MTKYTIVRGITALIDFNYVLFIIVAYIEVYTHTKFEVTWTTFRGGDHVFYGQKSTKIHKNPNSRRPPAPAGLMLLCQIGQVSTITNHKKNWCFSSAFRNYDISKLGHSDQKSQTSTLTKNIYTTPAQ